MKIESGPKRVMITAEIYERVSKLAPRFLKGLAPEEVTAVLEAATLQRFQANTVIASEGHIADKLFLILEGRARTFTATRDGGKVLLIRIPEGDSAGGRAILSQPQPYLVSTETVIDTYALVWNRSAMLGLTKQYPILLENALLIASDYIEAYRDMHVAASRQTAPQRVARVLDGLAREIGRVVAEGVELKVGNEDIADEAGVTIFTVSRLLSDWQRKGLLIKGRGRVVLRSAEALTRCAC